MKWFTSDWHLGHKNIAGPKISTWPDRYRNFDSVEEMDATIIDAYNKYVKQGDQVFFLGDFTMGGKGQWATYLRRLICPFWGYIVGNHDKETPWDMGGYWAKTGQILETRMTGWEKEKDKSRSVVMCHYPMRTWNKSHHGSIHLYGHEHGGISDIEWGRSLDVGVDNAYQLFGEWRPFSEEDVMRILSKREKKIFGHHTGIR